MAKKAAVAISGTIFLFLIFSPMLALADFNISVTPYEGGFDLGFGKVNAVGPEVNKELIVNINSDIAKQYRIYQSILEPLNNGRGETISQNNFFVYGIRGSNKFGTLSVEEQMPVSMGRGIIYTSNQPGSSDSFTLVYSLRGPFNVASGQYRGRIGFVLQPIDSSQSQVTAILNISAEIEIESSVEIKTPSGSKTIVLNPAREDSKSAEVMVEIKGGLGSQFKILQIVEQPLMSSEGNEIQEGLVNFEVKEAKKGSGASGLTNLALARQVIYTSTSSGSADSFIITYSLANPLENKSGKYRTRIKYLLEGSSYFREGLLDTLTLEVENERMFNLIVTPEIGGSLQFRDLKPQQPPRINEVTLQVNSNIGKRYQLSQNMPSSFTSSEGQSIPSSYFTLKQESLKTKGTLKCPDKTEVKAGEMALFISDEFGSSDTFKLIYELTIPPDLHAGDYSTRIVYSLSEI